MWEDLDLLRKAKAMLRYGRSSRSWKWNRLCCMPWLGIPALSWITLIWYRNWKNCSRRMAWNICISQSPTGSNVAAEWTRFSWKMAGYQQGHWEVPCTYSKNMTGTYTKEVNGDRISRIYRLISCEEQVRQGWWPKISALVTRWMVVAIKIED
jgi:hypothetical protein